MSIDDFHEFCLKGFNLKKDESNLLAKYLDKLGYLMFRGEVKDLSEFVFYRPDWISKALNFVILDQDTISTNRVLDHGNLKHIWWENSRNAEERYPLEFHGFFLKLMEHFDVSFRLDEGRTSLIPEMLPHSRLMI